jgi:hypothetical protein
MKKLHVLKLPMYSLEDCRPILKHGTSILRGGSKNALLFFKYGSGTDLRAFPRGLNFVKYRGFCFSFSRNKIGNEAMERKKKSYVAPAQKYWLFVHPHRKGERRVW